MGKRKAFTLIELLVVIAIIALLMSILMPAMSRVKQQAKTISCRANMKQWTLFFNMYTQDYDGYFEAGVGSGHTYHWMNALRPYYRDDPKVRCCPTAMKPLVDEFGQTAPEWNVFSAWGRFWGEGYSEEGDYGSYGINGWVENPPPDRATVYENFETVNNWRTPNVPEAPYVPLFMDALRFNVFPRHTDNPPDFQDTAWEGTQHMRRACIDRHDGFINMAFLDWSVRKVGLKELWTLRWHKAYLQSGPWTKAGGVLSSDWPEWMRGFKEY
ncbi:MAG: prepilin-type N-terminal cleavage/methylation domain-containing protein [Sedimentisphaerales bacterium]|nr:prepilin-type N-terminal cleavage/methylation domain-containing protein [Sedimentisphaerales bacterium]